MKTFIFSIILMIALGTDSYGQITASGLNDNMISQKDLKKIIVYGSGTCHYCIAAKA
jgi:glutaredoxin 3